MVFSRRRPRLRPRVSGAGAAAIEATCKTRVSVPSVPYRVRVHRLDKTMAAAISRRWCSASSTRRPRCSASIKRCRSVNTKGRRDRIKAIVRTTGGTTRSGASISVRTIRRYSTRGGYGYGYGSRTVIVPRYITPRFVTVVPYRPYVYRPSIGIGIYYGTGGSYPYGYTPRGYYDPIAGRPYGGLRITGFSEIAQVFADGYYVGIVNDFDGVFQHLNLEAGPHQIEVREPGLEPIAFDVMVQAGRTITFRADAY